MRFSNKFSLVSTASLMMAIIISKHKSEK